jgi:hypothetical protein
MDLYSKMRRARRLDRTLVIAKRRRDEHLARNHYDDTTGLTQVDCACELSNTMFSKRTAYGCGCRKRTKGRPKVANGLCKIGARDHIIKLRQEARQVRNDAVTGRGYEEPPTRRWAKAKTSPRMFTIDKRNISRKGVPGAWWTEVRAYRTERDRDNALATLRKTAPVYPWPGYKTKTVEYTGPRYEFQAGPTKSATPTLHPIEEAKDQAA